MGFFIRKSFGGKHLKFNLSKSGIGTSFGVKGLRFGVDGKGRSYISGGKGIFRYRKYFSSNDSMTEIQESNKNKAGCFSCGLFFALLLCFLPPVGQILLGIFIYLLPYLIADLANLKNKNKIYWINILFGITIIGWFVVLFMTLYGIKSNAEISKLENKLQDCLPNEASNIIEYLIKKCPEKETEYKLFLIQIYQENQMYNEALEVIEQNYLGETRQLKMQILEKLERYEDIINIIQNEFTDEEKEKHPVIYAFLAEAFLKMNKPNVAIEALSQGPINTKKMTDEMCAFRYALGECYVALGDKENALKQYNKVFAYNADFEDVASKIKELS